MRKPWHKRDDESPQAYDAFRVYLDMDPDERTNARVAQALRKSATLINRWSAAHDWQARVAAYEAHLDRELERLRERKLRDRAGEWIERQERLREREWDLQEKLIAKAEEILKLPTSRVERVVEDGNTTIVIHPVRASFSHAARMIDLASKLGRLATGQPTDHTRIDAPAPYEDDDDVTARLVDRILRHADARAEARGDRETN